MFKFPFLETSEESASLWAYALTVMLISLCLRATIFTYGFVENDEYIYHALIEQIIKGKGYTLQGSSLLDLPGVSRAMYDSPVFFHPPVGIYFFWLVQGVVGLDIAGLKVAQLVSFVIFYLSLFTAFRLLFPKPSKILSYSFPLLLAFNPIYGHTNMKVWIDNPRLAFFCLHFLCCIYAMRKKDGGTLAVCAVSSILSTLTKVEVVLCLPFMYGFVWSLEPTREGRRFLLRFFGALLFLNLAVAMGWLWYSEALKYGPGRPSEELLLKNSFIRQVTLTVTSQKLVLDFFKLITTALPVLLILGFCLGREKLRTFNPRYFLAGWLVFQLMVFAGLGLFGYSKLLRYYLMTAPATCLLYAYAVEDLREHWKKNLAFMGVAVLLFVAFQIEIIHGLRPLLWDSQYANILPLF